jgi:hypothetical protein
MGISTRENEGLAVTAYSGDRTVLLAFDLPEERIDNLAGFAVAVSEPGSAPRKKDPYFIPNRLNFARKVTAKTPYNADLWTPSDRAPFQSFHWAHYPSLGSGTYTYTVAAMYFTKGEELKRGPAVNVPADLRPPARGVLNLGFTRTMISSQAYATRFNNKALYPEPQTIDFDTRGYSEQYTWLGAHAGELVTGFLEDCVKDHNVTVDAFTFDLNDPVVVGSICELGPRARVYQDNSASHTCANTDVEGMTSKETKKKPPLEPEAVKAMRRAKVEVKTGHFGGLSHNKVLIRRRKGMPEAVLTGSANFSIRGLYVQANSVLVFEDARVAGLYAQAFDQAWTEPEKFRKSPISASWHDLSIGGNRYSFSFAPHATPYPLDKIKEAVDNAKSSVLFAMMQVASSTGPAVKAIRDLPGREDIFSLGVIQNEGDVSPFGPDTGDQNFALASAAYLARNVPPPFKKEISGGSGQVIHHKLVVCDFNGKNPVVFCGSSNLAAGGETGNSDNLMAIHDPDVAIMYAVETIRQYAHFRFRGKQEHATSADPLILQGTDAWARPYYENGNIRKKERLALIPETT